LWLWRPLWIVRQQQLELGWWEQHSKVLVGAGSTFVAPLVQSWAGAYVKTPAAVTVTYGAIG
jgi:ABC-type phosphate transport system, periplasmic component